MSSTHKKSFLRDVVKVEAAKGGVMALNYTLTLSCGHTTTGVVEKGSTAPKRVECSTCKGENRPI